MTKSTLVVTLALGLLAAPLAVPGQPGGKIPRIGVLSPISASDWAWVPSFEAFRQGLRDLGYVEGRTIAIEWRWAEGNYDRLPALAAELVRLKVDCIVTHGPASLAAKGATATIPIVLALSGDPVAQGLVASLARPGGNITGLSLMLPELRAKALELLKEAAPRISRVALLFNPDRWQDPTVKAMERAARALNLTFQPVGVRRPDELEGAFAVMAAGRADALAVTADTVISANARRVADLAVQHRLPSLGFTEWPEAGGLLTYDVDTIPVFRRAAAYVDKILKGANPADLPIEQPTKFKLIVNLKTAKVLGLTIPQSLLLRTDELIQ